VGIKEGGYRLYFGEL
jgi:hypothetical protein